MIKKRKFIENLSLFNFVLFFIGFDFTTTFFSIFINNLESTSQLITVPYRAFTLFIGCLVILCTIRTRIKYNLGLFLLIIYILFFTIRFIFDFFIRTDIYIDSIIRSQYALLYLNMLIIAFSLMKSYKYILLTNAFKWIYIGFAATILISFITTKGFSLNNIVENYQVSAGIRNTIDTGYLASFYLLMSFYFIKNKEFPVIYKLLNIPIIIMASIILLRSGSRGPFLAIVIAFSLYLLFKKKKIIWTIFFTIVLIITFNLFFYSLLDFISEISPVMAYRIQFAVESTGEEKRLEFFLQGIENFIDNPFWGSQAMLYRSSLTPTFPHQLIIEAFMSTGIFGGLSLTFSLFILIKMILKNLYNSNYWLELIMVAMIVRAMTAGSMFGFVFPIIFSFYLLKRYSNKDIIHTLK